MFRERNERPSTGGEAEERSGYTELCEVARLGFRQTPKSCNCCWGLAGKRVPPGV